MAQRDLCAPQCRQHNDGSKPKTSRAAACARLRGTQAGLWTLININVIWSAASHVKRSGVHTLIWTETIHSAPQCAMTHSEIRISIVNKNHATVYL